MRKPITLLLAVIMCLHLCACNDPEPSVPPVADFVYGQWFSISGDTVTLHDDGSCQIGGEMLSYKGIVETEENVYQVILYSGETPLYLLSFWPADEYNFRTLAVFPVENGTATDSFTEYYSSRDITVVELTPENWIDYFEVRVIPEFQKNTNGDVEAFVTYSYLVNKDNIHIAAEFSQVTAEYVPANEFRFTEIDAVNETYTTGELIYTEDLPQESQQMYVTEIADPTTSDNKYGFEFGATITRRPEEGKMDFITISQMIAIEGTIYILHPEE